MTNTRTRRRKRENEENGKTREKRKDFKHECGKSFDGDTDCHTHFMVC